MAINITWSRRFIVHLVVTKNETDVSPYTWRLQWVNQTSYRPFHLEVTEGQSDVLSYISWLQNQMFTQNEADVLTIPDANT